MKKLRITLALALGMALLSIAPGVLPTRTALAQQPTCFGRQATRPGFIGTSADDVLIGNANANRIAGRGGNDALCGLDGGDTLIGGAGDDSIDGGAGNDTIKGSGGNDTIVGGAGQDNIEGGGGNDTILAKDGEIDTIDCGGLLGGASDTVQADPFDVVDPDCENVTF